MLKAMAQLFPLQALLEVEGAWVTEAEQFRYDLSVQLATTTGWHKANFWEADSGVRSIKVERQVNRAVFSSSSSLFLPKCVSICAVVHGCVSECMWKPKVNLGCTSQCF